MAGTKQSFESMSEDNFNAAYAAFKGKIRTFSRNAVGRIPGYDIEDIEQELCYTLMRCVRDYDPNKGASFNTLFQGSAQRKIMDLIRLTSTKSRSATIVYLEQDEVRLAVEGLLFAASAEDEALAPLVLDDYSAEDITKALRLTRAERRKVSAA